MSLASRIVRYIELERQSVRPIRRYRTLPSSDLNIMQAGDVPFVIEPPDVLGWEILAAQWIVLASSGDLFPQITVVDRTTGRDVIQAQLPMVPNGEVYYFYLFQGSSTPVYTFPGLGGGMVFPLPLDGELKDESIRLELLGGAAADEHRVAFYYEEFKR